jgi:hypothetical protein
MVRVNHVGTLSACDPGNGRSESWLEAAPPAERRNVNTFCAQLHAPYTFVVQTAHSHGHLAAEPPNYVEHQTLCATRSQRQNKLQDMRIRT